MNFIASTGPHISIAPDVLFHIGPVPITNSQILGLIGSLILIWLLVHTVRGVRSGSKRRLVHAVYWLFEGLYDLTVEVIGDKKIARRITPLAVTLFLFFLINNWLGLLPVVGPGTVDHQPLCRGAAADLNTTLALALISIITAQIWAIRRRGFFGNIRRYLHNPF